MSLLSPLLSLERMRGSQNLHRKIPASTNDVATAVSLCTEPGLINTFCCDGKGLNGLRLMALSPMTKRAIWQE